MFYKAIFALKVNILEDYLDNIIVGEQNIPQGDVSVEDSLLCKMAETSWHLDICVNILSIIKYYTTGSRQGTKRHLDRQPSFNFTKTI